MATMRSGRVVSRSIDGSANPVTWSFDALGRVTQETNLLGSFTYGYDGVTPRVATVTYPNGQTSAYSYLPVAQDARLQTIHHRYPNASTLSKFAYTYDVVGNILTWRQQADTAAVVWKYGYDAADQVTLAVKESTDPTPVVLARYGYAYDAAGNRTAEQIDDAVTGASYDGMNRLTSQQPGGLLRFAGSVSEPATVTIGGTPATVATDNRFAGQAPVTAGTNPITITATDPSGNQAVAVYEVPQTGTSKAFAYDANGNMTSDGTRTFEWDARNQLVAVNAGPLRTEFSYNGANQRVRARELVGATVLSDARWIIIGDYIAEHRPATGSIERFWMWASTSGSATSFLVGSQNLGTPRD